MEAAEKLKSFQNHFKIISKSFQNHFIFHFTILLYFLRRILHCKKYKLKTYYLTLQSSVPIPRNTHTINNDPRYQTNRFHPRCQPHESLRLLERGKEEPRDNRAAAAAAGLRPGML